MNFLSIITSEKSDLYVYNSSHPSKYNEKETMHILCYRVKDFLFILILCFSLFFIQDSVRTQKFKSRRFNNEGLFKYNKKILVAKEDKFSLSSKFLANLGYLLLTLFPFGLLFLFGDSYKITWFYPELNQFKILPLLFPFVFSVLVFIFFNKSALKLIYIPLFFCSFISIKLFYYDFFTLTFITDKVVDIPYLFSIKRNFSHAELLSIGSSLYYKAGLPPNIDFMASLINNNISSFTLEHYIKDIYNNISTIIDFKSKTIFGGVLGQTALLGIWIISIAVILYSKIG